LQLPSTPRVQYPSWINRVILTSRRASGVAN
jgi:hypothetical protein